MSTGTTVLNICNSFNFCVFPLSAKALKLESPNSLVRMHIPSPQTREIHLVQVGVLLYWDIIYNWKRRHKCTAC